MRRGIAALSFAAFAAPAFGGPIANPQCIAPARTKGGFDLTCRLAQSLLDGAPGITGSVAITYLPGGVGAVAFNVIVSRRPAEPGTIVAFSSGSLVNLALGAFGQHAAREVRWLAVIAADHGALVVHRDSPIRTLRDLQAALKRDPAKVAFGGGGVIGSQDWLKTAMVARRMGVDFKSLRFVSFEGGGQALAALRGGHLQVVAGDVAETKALIDEGAPLRILAVLSPARLPGKLELAPTAREQGFDVIWRTVRGFYMGPEVGDEYYRQWAELFRRAAKFPGYAERLQALGLQPFLLEGGELEAFVKQSIDEYRSLAREFGLRVNSPAD